MRTSRRKIVTLPQVMADQERTVEAWLHGPVAAAYDAVTDGRAELLTLEQVRAELNRLVGDA